MPTTKALVTIESAAETLGVAPRTVRRYITQGRLVGFRVGPRLIRVAEDDVAALLRPMGPKWH